LNELFQPLLVNRICYFKYTTAKFYRTACINLKHPYLQGKLFWSSANKQLKKAHQWFICTNNYMSEHAAFANSTY